MPKPRESKFMNDSAVAQILADAINNSSKTQSQIALEVGFERPNMVSMIKQGYSNLPIYKAKLIADSLGIDAKKLLNCCMEEYWAEEWAVIREVYGIETGHTHSSDGLQTKPSVDHLPEKFEQESARTRNKAPPPFAGTHSASIKQAETIIANKFEAIKPGNKKMAGFQTNSGRQMALQRDVQRINIWTEDLDAPQQIAPYERYSADRPRHSNLASQAPRLATGNGARLWRPESAVQLEALVTWYSNI